MLGVVAWDYQIMEAIRDNHNTIRGNDVLPWGPFDIPFPTKVHEELYYYRISMAAGESRPRLSVPFSAYMPFFHIPHTINIDSVTIVS